MARTVKFTYATCVDGRGQPYPASRDATAPFFFLASYRPMTYPKASKGKKVGGGRAGTAKVRLPPSYRTMPPEVRY